MRFGAVDIGSNAVRLLIAEVEEYDGKVNVKKLSLTRVPVRLGASVFDTGMIIPSKVEKLGKTMDAFKNLMEVYDVIDFRVCATSAMREAINAKEVIAGIKESSGFDIEVIDGKIEADLIFSTFETQKIDATKTYLYIDVGGGSTEVSLLKNGKPVASRSFKIGTVRIIKEGVVPQDWDDMRAWVKEVTAGEQNLIAIGTGGNINRYAKLAGMKFGEFMSFDELRKSHEYISELTYEERIERLRMRADRADVVVPAGEIYIQIMKTANISQISIPKVGLSDGMVLWLYHKHLREV